MKKCKCKNLFHMIQTKIQIHRVTKMNKEKN
jgi:hypothetical protein